MSSKNLGHNPLLDPKWPHHLLRVFFSQFHAGPQELQKTLHLYLFIMLTYHHYTLISPILEEKKIFLSMFSRCGRPPSNKGVLPFFKSLFSYFEREGMSRGGAEREGEIENPKQAPHCQHGAQCQARTPKL